MITSESGKQYLKPDYLSPLPESPTDSKQSPLALLAQTCSQIGADSPLMPSRPAPQAAAPAKKTSPKPAFKPYELEEKRKSPRESPSRASPKYPDYLKALYPPRACRDPYCQGCPAGLAQLAALAQPYVCSWVSGESTFCGKRFTTPEELLQHLRSHTGEPRYPRFHPYTRLFPYLPPYYPPYLYPSRLPPL